MKKTLILFTLALAMATTGFSQTEPYNKDYNYSFFSNWTIGASGIASKTTDFQDWKVGDGISFGAELRATKRVGTLWNLRYIAEVPGLYTKTSEYGTQYDRYGKAMAGISFNFLPNLYLFADAGASVNPSEKRRYGSMLGLAGQAGLGLNTSGNVGKLYVELGADRTQNVPRSWNSNLFAKVGYAFNLGITEKDRQNLSVLRHQPETINELRSENEHIREQLEFSYKTNNELAQTLNKATSICERLDAELKECQESKPTAGAEALFNIYFDRGSSEISDIEEEKIQILANRIIEQGGNYTVDGYCSTEGSDELNQTLSYKRACEVMEALVNAGVPSHTLTATGHGKTSDFGSAPLNRCVRVNRN